MSASFGYTLVLEDLMVKAEELNAVEADKLKEKKLAEEPYRYELLELIFQEEDKIDHDAK